MTQDDMMSSEAGIKYQLAALYNMIPMDAFSSADQSTFLRSNGRVSTRVGYGRNITGWWSYGNLRHVNLFIEGLPAVLEKKVINQDTYNTLVGEAKFIRAYFYFAGVRNVGGMPILTKTLDNEEITIDDEGNITNENLFIPRSTEKETWDFVLAELDEAAKLLPETISGGELRANKYVALALKSRVALWAASVAKYWETRPLDASYTAVKKDLTKMYAKDANGYYQQCIDAAAQVINSGKYKLYGFSGSRVDPETAAKNLSDLFQSIKGGEYIFGKTYKTGVNNADNGVESWAPYQTNQDWNIGNGALTANMADAYADMGPNGETIKGAIKTNVKGEDYVLGDPYTDPAQISNILDDLVRYDTVDGPFVNKDARFKAWVIWPGSTFRGMTMNMQAGMIKPDKTVLCCANPTTGGNAPVVFNGATYYPYGVGSSSNADYSAFYMANVDYNSTNAFEFCFGTKKYLNPETKASYTQSPWYDIRYAEVLLNYAEAVAESGLGDKALAQKCLNDVHMRAGFAGDLALTVDNVLDEVRAEFMLENHWQGVLQRRRAYYNSDLTAEQNKLEGNGNKHTFLPMVDLSGSEVKYVFPRALPFWSRTSTGTLNFRVQNDSYYGAISNYGKNKIDNNNTK